MAQNTGGAGPATDPGYAELPMYTDYLGGAAAELLLGYGTTGNVNDSTSTISPQHIDEYTKVSPGDVWMILSGQNISSQLSTKFEGCINRESMNDINTQPQQSPIDGSSFTLHREAGVTGLGGYQDWLASTGIIMGLYSRSQTWFDPDQGNSIMDTGTPDFGGYGSVSYPDPFSYSAAEATGLYNLFGFEYAPGDSDGSVGSTTRVLMQRATDKLIEDMMTGFIPRSDITRRTPDLPLTDSSFEKITGKEVSEDISIIGRIGLNQSQTNSKVNVTDASVRAAVIKRAAAAAAVADGSATYDHSSIDPFGGGGLGGWTGPGGGGGSY